MYRLYKQMYWFYKLKKLAFPYNLILQGFTRSCHCSLRTYTAHSLQPATSTISPRRGMPKRIRTVAVWQQPLKEKRFFINISCCYCCFLQTKYSTTFSISISVTSLCLSSICIASSFCLCFNSKSRLNLSASLGAFWRVFISDSKCLLIAGLIPILLLLLLLLHC